MPNPHARPRKKKSSRSPNAMLIEPVEPGHNWSPPLEISPGHMRMLQIECYSEGVILGDFFLNFRLSPKILRAELGRFVTRLRDHWVQFAQGSEECKVVNKKLDLKRRGKPNSHNAVARALGMPKARVKKILSVTMKGWF